MSKIVTVGTEEFELPVQGSNPDYGEELTDFFEAVADSLANVQQPNDVLRTTSVINNNISSFANIPGFSFDTAEVVTINAEYITKRSTVSPAATKVESGFIQGNFDGSSWTLSHETDGDAGIEFTITAGGQMQYKSDNMVGTGYVGSIIFRAKVFNESE